jgi:hypothetical protein
MGIAAAPVILSAVVLLQTQFALIPKSSPAIARQANGHSTVFPANPKNRVADVMGSNVPRGESAVMSGDTQMIPLSYFNAQIGEHRVEIRLPGVEPVAANSRILSDQPRALNYEMVRLANQPSGGDVFQRDLLLAESTPALPATDEADVAAEETSTGSHASIVVASLAKNHPVEIKGHAIAHHRHRPRKHGPPSMLAKIGRSVKEAWTSVLTFPRTAKERLSWD